MEWSLPGDRHDVGPVIREFTDVAASRVRRDAGKTVAEQILASRWRIDD